MWWLQNGALGSTMPENVSLANCCETGGRDERSGWLEADGARPSGIPRPPWVAPALSAVLIVTTAVDVLGNLLVIFSVLKNRKLRNAGERHARCRARAVPLASGPDPDPAIRCLSPPHSWAPRSFLSNLVPKFGIELKI